MAIERIVIIMQKLCNMLSKFIIVWGGVGSIIAAIVFGKETTVSVYGVVETERNWGLTIGIFLATLISVFLLFVIFAALAEVLENQDHILYNQSKYTDNKASTEKQGTNISTKKDMWVCPHCGTSNSSTQHECKDCGYER